jgi:broad specificity phosphatase PhoE
MQTAEIVARPHGLVVRHDARLGEVNFGESEGLTGYEINDRYSVAFQQWDGCMLAAPSAFEQADDAERGPRKGPDDSSPVG